jgi:hypothetical protein
MQGDGPRCRRLGVDVAMTRNSYRGDDVAVDAQSLAKCLRPILPNAPTTVATIARIKPCTRNNRRRGVAVGGIVDGDCLRK